jgi:hypothetical protein
MIGLMLVHLGPWVFRHRLEKGKRYRVHVHAAACEAIFDAAFDGWHGEPIESDYVVAQWDNGVKLCGPAWTAHEIPKGETAREGEADK